MNISPKDNDKDIEAMLYGMDFSAGHEANVWEKVLARLNIEDELNLDSLDNVAGGLSKPQVKNDNGSGGGTK